jgi:GGDEF domain-containing protein
MEPNETRTLVRFSKRCFHNFSEAADELLGALADALPGVVVLSRLDPDERLHRVIEVRGEGVSGLRRGASLPLAGDHIDADSLRSLGARDWLSKPLEMSDGRIVGVLCAADTQAGAYLPEHAAQLGVAARLLSYEWESVELRSELRRLRGRLSAGSGADIDTGLPDRDGFLDQLAHEWRLVERGTIESVLVACRVGTANGAAGTSAKRKLALKLAAETLSVTTRDTDRIGRVGESTVAAVLIGCDPESTPAFLARFLGALERVTEGSGPEIEVSFGVQPLADTSSPIEALDLAEDAAGEPGRVATGELHPQAQE